MALPTAWNARQWCLDLDVAPSYRSGLTDGLAVLEPLEDYGDYRRPRGQSCFLFDGVDDFLSAPHLAGTEIATNDGTATLQITAGRIDSAAGGTCWNIQIDDGTVYHCNEEAGDAGTNTTVYDSSGAGNDAVINNATLSTFHSTSTSVLVNAANDDGFTFGVNNVIIPQDASAPTLDVLGGALQFTGRAPMPASVSSPVATFDGVDDHCQNVANDLSSTGTDWTFSFWCKNATNGTSQYMYDQGTPRMVLFWDDTLSRLGMFDGAFKRFDSNPSDGLWHNIVFAADGTGLEMKCYVDGIQSGATLAFTPLALGSTNQIFIAQGNGGTSRCNGSMSDIRVYDRTLTLTDAQFIASNGGIGTDPGAPDVASWSFNEGDGTTVFDTSGNNVELTVTNATLVNFWADRSDAVRDHCIQYGGRMESTVFVPALLDGSNAANGSPITLGPGTFGNPGSRLLYDNWSAPELAPLLLPAESIVGELLRNIAPTDQKYRSEENVGGGGEDGNAFADGDNRIFNTLAALTGQDLTDAISYIERTPAGPAFLAAWAEHSTQTLQGTVTV